MSETRKLAAILASDVAGYSRLMGEDEAGTARAVRQRREAAAPIVRAFGGRLVKTMGDGVLLEFPSVVAAVECSIVIQKMMVERNLDLPEDNRLHYQTRASRRSCEALITATGISTCEHRTPAGGAPAESAIATTCPWSVAM
jgi:class 3 adenylate cyclase